MPEKPIIFVCMVERCENSQLYRDLCATDGLDVRNANCRGYCGLGNRVDVYYAHGMHMFARTASQNPNLTIEELGDDPVKQILGYAT